MRYDCPCKQGERHHESVLAALACACVPQGTDPRHEPVNRQRAQVGDPRNGSMLQPELGKRRSGQQVAGRSA